MPKVLNFKPKSVIYFQGDHTSYFYLLVSGQLTLTDTLSNKSEIITPGSFFGTQATLIGKPQTHTALASESSEVINFNQQEFLALLEDNEQLRLSMINNFISQLTDIHSQVIQLMDKAKDDTDNTNFSDILLKTAHFFLKNCAYQQAKQSYEVYLKRFPSTEFSSTVKEKISYCQEKVGSSEDLSAKLYLSVSGQDTTTKQIVATPMQIEYDETVALINQKKFSQALLRLTKLTRMQNDPSYPNLIASCYFLLSETFIQMNKYAEAIEPLQIFTLEYNTHKDIDKAYIYLATAYEKNGQEENAKEIYNLLQEKLSVDSELYTEINKKLTSIIEKKNNG